MSESPSRAVDEEQETYWHDTKIISWDEFLSKLAETEA